MSPRKDNFIKKIDGNYHKPNTTYGLLRVPYFKSVTNVSFDYIYLIRLGNYVRKLIYLWVEEDLHY